MIRLLCYVVTGITTVADTTTTEVDTVAGKQEMNISICRHVETLMFGHNLVNNGSGMPQICTIAFYSNVCLLLSC